MSTFQKKVLIGVGLLAAVVAIVAIAGPLTGNTETLPSGVIIQDLKVGSGPAVKKGDTIKVHYVGTLKKDGKKFDNSPPGKPVEFKLAASGGPDDPGVIEGWVEGIPGMKVGGKRKLTIPAALAYGSRGRGEIPPNADLVFEVELVEIVK